MKPGKTLDANSFSFLNMGDAASLLFFEDSTKCYKWVAHDLVTDWIFKDFLIL